MERHPQGSCIHRAPVPQGWPVFFARLHSMFNSIVGCVCPLWPHHRLRREHSAERRENQLKHSSAWYKNRKRSYHRCGDEPGDAVSGACLGTVFITFILERGTNSILDKKDGGLLSGITAIKILAKNASHTNGGGILYTVHDNLLVGPNAVETWEVEAPGPPGLRRDVKRLFLGFTDGEESFSKNVAKNIRRITHRYGAWV